MKKIILSAVVISFALFSCKKSDKTCDLNSASFAGTFKVTAIKSKANATAPEVDEFATYDACEKDDLIIFNTNGTTTYQDAGTVCVPDGNDTGTWALSGNTVTLDGTAGTVAYFDCNSTAISLTYITGETFTISLARQ